MGYGREKPLEVQQFLCDKQFFFHFGARTSWFFGFLVGKEKGYNPNRILAVEQHLLLPLNA